MCKFYSNDFDFDKDQLIQLINAFNILDNINLLGSVVLYKLGKYKYDINLEISKEYFYKINLKASEENLNNDVLFLMQNNQINILEWFYYCKIQFDFKQYFIYVW